MTLDLDEFERLKDALGGSVYTADPFPIIVSYANDDQPTVTDVLPRVKITKTETSGKEGEDNAGTRKLDFIILAPIKWNGDKAYD
jgi:hypothetical protein